MSPDLPTTTRVTAPVRSAILAALADATIGHKVEMRPQCMARVKGEIDLDTLYTSVQPRAYSRPTVIQIALVIDVIRAYPDRAMSGLDIWREINGYCDHPHLVKTGHIRWIGAFRNDPRGILNPRKGTRLPTGLIRTILLKLDEMDIVDLNYAPRGSIRNVKGLKEMALV